MFVIYFAHKQSQAAAHCEVFCECIYNRSQPHISLNQQACLEIFMTWMLKLLFSQPSPGKTVPEGTRHTLSKGTLRHLKTHWNTAQPLRSCKHCTKHLIPTATSVGEGCVTQLLQHQSSSNLCPSQDLKRSCLLWMCHLPKQPCLAARNDFVSVPGWVLPFSSPRSCWQDAGSLLVWGCWAPRIP